MIQVINKYILRCNNGQNEESHIISRNHLDFIDSHDAKFVTEPFWCISHLILMHPVAYATRCQCNTRKPYRIHLHSWSFLSKGHPGPLDLHMKLGRQGHFVARPPRRSPRCSAGLQMQNRGQILPNSMRCLIGTAQVLRQSSPPPLPHNFQDVGWGGGQYSHRYRANVWKWLPSPAMATQLLHYNTIVQMIYILYECRL